MSNWIVITAADVTERIDADIYNASVAKGFDVAEAIGDAVSRIRGAVARGNTLDANAAAIPRSLKGLAVRIVIRACKAMIEYPLTRDEQDERTEDRSYINRIGDDKMRFETPDTPAGHAEMQSGETIDTVTRTNRRNYTRGGMDGLL